MTNKYFDTFQEPSEQNLLQDLITESIQIFGMDIYYIPKNQHNTNSVLGEDTTSTYDNAYVIESYLENVDGFEGDKSFLSNLGLNIAKSSNFLISDERFKQEIQKGPFNIPNPNVDLNQFDRPLEGDLIFFPLTKGLFEVKFADHEAVFYQLGKIYAWRLTVEMFRYSNEVFNTGIPEIDIIATQFRNNNSIANDPLADNDQMKTNLDAILDNSSNLEIDLEGYNL